MIYPFTGHPALVKLRLAAFACVLAELVMIAWGLATGRF